MISAADDMPPGGYPPGTSSGTFSGEITLAPGHTALTFSAPGLPPVTLDLLVKSGAPTGVTLSPLAFPGGWTHRQCYEDWSAHFGAPDAAKAYLRSYPTALGRDGQLPAMRDLGIKPVVCFDAVNHLDPMADAAPLAATCQMLASEFAHAPGWVVFMQEPNTAKHAAPGWDAAAFIGLSQKLYPVVKGACGWPVLFCPSTGGTHGAVSTWYPSPAGCDGIAPDHYCGAGGSKAAMPAFAAAAEIAARDSLPAGVGWLECGISASSPSRATQALVTQMLYDGASFFIARKLAGLACAPWLWWNGPLAAPTDASPAQNAIWPEGFAPANAYAAPLWQAACARVAVA